MSAHAQTSRSARRKLSDAQQLKQLSVALLCAAEAMDPVSKDYRQDSAEFYRKLYNERAMAVAEVIVRMQKRRFSTIRRKFQIRDDA